MLQASKKEGKNLRPRHTSKLILWFTWKQKALRKPKPGNPVLGGAGHLDVGTRYIHMDVYNATMYSCRNLNTVVKLLLHWKIQNSHIALKAW